MIGYKILLSTLFVSVLYLVEGQWRYPYEAQWDQQYADECPIGQPYPCWRPPFYPFDPIEREIDDIGKIIGRSMVYGIDRYVNMFIGVPYARPPLHELRFAPPEDPHRGWGWDVREWDASFYRPACPQPMWKIDNKFYETRNVSEDCLYLNIFQPNLTYKGHSDNRQCGHFNDKHPVMVMIHGDDFVSGDSQLHPGHVVAKREVIVVTFNYRLGALGFMSTLDDHSRGNYGIYDVLKVLQFIQSYIHKFCGDPNRVTLVGFGSGAAIAGILTLSPKSIHQGTQLFHGAIMMGGSDLCEWATVQPAWSSNAREYAKDLGREVGCYPDYGLPWQRLVDCLRYKHFDEIVNATAYIAKKYGTLSGPFGPVVDEVNGILPKTPQELRDQGNFLKIPIMAGINKDDGAYFAYNITKDIVGLDMDMGLDPGTFREILYEIVNGRELIRNKHEVVGAMEFEYTFWAKPDNKTAVRQNLVDFYSDMMWGYCVDAAIKSYASMSTEPVYMYVFHHRSIFETLPEWMGIPYGKDVEYLFGYPFMNETLGNLTGLQPMQWDYTYEDKNISVFLQDAFANFTKYKVPTPEWIRNVTWYPFSPHNLSYLHISADWMYMNINYRQSHFAFWRDYFPIMSTRWPITTTIGPTPYPNKEYRISTWALMGACIVVLFIIGALGITLWRTTKSDTELY